MPAQKLHLHRRAGAILGDRRQRPHGAAAPPVRATASRHSSFESGSSSCASWIRLQGRSTHIRWGS